RTPPAVAALAALAPRLVRLARHDYPDGLLGLPMPSLKALRKRIATVRSTQQITKAMKMVAAAKLRRAQEAAERARPYAAKLADMFAAVAAGIEPETHPLLARREERRIDLLVVSSDRGLCGGYNANLFRHVAGFLRQRAGQELAFVLVGRK